MLDAPQVPQQFVRALSNLPVQAFRRRGSAISNRDRFGALLTGGTAMSFFLRFAANMGMIMGLMPVVVPLPLISYG